jgi:hypothetical protein
MNAADPPAKVLVDFQLDGMVSVVRVSGEVDIATCGHCAKACFESSPLSPSVAWSSTWPT